MKLSSFFLLPLIIPGLKPHKNTEILPPIPHIQNSSQVLPAHPILISQENRTRRLKFAPRQNAIVVEDAVVRGTRDIYLIRVKKHQKMKIKITSIENNAGFDIEDPQGKIIPSKSTTNWQGILQHTGDYKIIVGSTRGNATYNMKVTIN